MADKAVVLRRRIAAPPDRLFRAWTDPALLARWMSPVGSAVAEIDPRVGGRLRVVMIGDGQTIEHAGEFLELDAPHRLVFTWSSPFTGDVASRVTVELTERRDGTDLTLRHELLPEEAVASHAGGWSAMLDRLAAILAAAPQEVPHGP